MTLGTSGVTGLTASSAATAPSATRTTRAAPTTPQPNTCDTFGPCSAAQQGQMRSEGTCKQCFCECSATRWQQICCQPGLVFNPDKAGGQCDWPYNMPDCKSH